MNVKILSRPADLRPRASSRQNRAGYEESSNDDVIDSGREEFLVRFSAPTCHENNFQLIVGYIRSIQKESDTNLAYVFYFTLPTLKSYFQVETMQTFDL